MNRVVEEYAHSGTAVLTRPDLDDGSLGTDDWYAIKGERAWRTPCGRSGMFMAEEPCPHRVIVWPKEDDPNLLSALKMLRDEDNEIGRASCRERVSYHV